MNARVIVPLFLIVFLIGGLYGSIHDSDSLSRDLVWERTKLPDNMRMENPLSEMASRSRWDVVLPEGEFGPGGAFADRFKLIAVVGTNSKYALLQTVQQVSGQAATILRVAVDDVVQEGWRVLEIGDAEIVVANNGEEKRVKLFPQRQ
jgi:hypothetical protein